MITILICLLIADFLTGLAHWAEDTYGVPSIPFIGKWVIEPNIEHHKHPGWMGTMGNWISRNLQPVFLVVVGCLLIWSIGLFTWPVLLVGILTALGNEVHAWNHRAYKDNNWIVRFIQDTAIVQTKRQHSMHHIAPYDKYYCTLTNLTNAILERVNFWRGLEWALFKVFGLTVKRMSEERGGF